MSQISNIELQYDTPQFILWSPFGNITDILTEGKGSLFFCRSESTDEKDLVFVNMLTVSAGSNNIYKFSFTPIGWEIGYYKLVLSGKFIKDNITTEVRKELGFMLQASDKVTYLIWMLQHRLLDYPNYYVLDRDTSGNLQRYWSWQDFYTYIRSAVCRFNETGNLITCFGIDNIPVEDILITGAQGYALLARGRIEKANTFTYSDTPAITIDRSAYYDTAGGKCLSDFDIRAKTYKQTRISGAG